MKLKYFILPILPAAILYRSRSLRILPFALVRKVFRSKVMDIDQPQELTYFPRSSSHKPLFSSVDRPVAQGTFYSILNEDDTTETTKLPEISPLPRSERAPKAGLLSYFRWWMPELFASLVSGASLISLIVLVRSYHGRGIGELNLPYSVTLNGLVALISTVNRVALMVPVRSILSHEVWLWFSGTKRQSQLWDLEVSDAVSPGAWGSFLFLFKTSTR